MRATSKLEYTPCYRHVERTSVSLDDAGALRLAVIADTHSKPHPKAHGRIAALRPHAILHAGDIGDLEVLRPLRDLSPLVVVRGNIDARAHDLPDVVLIDVRAGDQTVFKLLLTHIAVRGPKLRKEVAQLAHEHEAQLVVCGHSHVPFIGRDKGISIFNPGSIGPRRMHLPILLGSLEIANGKLSLRHIDAETGREWAP